MKQDPLSVNSRGLFRVKGHDMSETTVDYDLIASFRTDDEWISWRVERWGNDYLVRCDVRITGAMCRAWRVSREAALAASSADDCRCLAVGRPVDEGVCG